MLKTKQLLGKLLAEQIKQYPIATSINDVEFSVYSQFGEDGIIQFITHHLRNSISNKIFVEIGVENYNEANTRFLLENNTWQGVVIDSSHMDIKQIKGSEYYWRTNLHAKHAFVTRENINLLLEDLKLPKEIGLLSIDIDGNDYWVLENIDVLSPAIVIVEYNSFFGPEAPISIPYRDNFTWRKFHPATYFGASLAAFNYLLERKGYEFLGCTSAGNNAFFVRKDINQGRLTTVSCEEGYRPPIFNSIHCESTDKFSEQRKCLRNLQVVNVVENTLVRVNGEEITHQSLSEKFNRCDDFLELEGEDFITYAYRYLLCREPDPEGFNSHLSELRRGVRKLEILRRILFSPEGKNTGVFINGLVTNNTISTPE